MIGSPLKTNFQANSSSNLSSLNDTIFFMEDVSVHFGELKALKSIELSVSAGEIIFLTGASGAGKTTLLKILSEEIVPTTGTFKKAETLANGKEIFLSQVFQDLRLVEELSIIDNLKFSFDPKLYKNKKEFDRDLMELSKVLGIADRLKLKARDCNGGLRQKIAIVRALLTRPDIFIADEPTSSLDFDNAKKLFDLLNLYNVKRKMTIIWASHNSELVKKFNGRIVHLDRGRLVYSGHACFI